MRQFQLVTQRFLNLQTWYRRNIQTALCILAFNVLKCPCKGVKCTLMGTDCMPFLKEPRLPRGTRGRSMFCVPFARRSCRIYEQAQETWNTIRIGQKILAPVHFTCLKRAKAPVSMPRPKPTSSKLAIYCNQREMKKVIKQRYVTYSY